MRAAVVVRLLLASRYMNSRSRCGKDCLAAIELLAVTLLQPLQLAKYINWVCVFRGTFGWCSAMAWYGFG
jgi:hypothetical protein